MSPKHTKSADSWAYSSGKRFRGQLQSKTNSTQRKKGLAYFGRRTRLIQQWRKGHHQKKSSLVQSLASTTINPYLGYMGRFSPLYISKISQRGPSRPLQVSKEGRGRPFIEWIWPLLRDGGIRRHFFHKRKKQALFRNTSTSIMSLCAYAVGKK